MGTSISQQEREPLAHTRAHTPRATTAAGHGTRAIPSTAASTHMRAFAHTHNHTLLGGQASNAATFSSSKQQRGAASATIQPATHGRRSQERTASQCRVTPHALGALREARACGAAAAAASACVRMHPGHDRHAADAQSKFLRLGRHARLLLAGDAGSRCGPHKRECSASVQGHSSGGDSARDQRLGNAQRHNSTQRHTPSKLRGAACCLN
jgi:hypothetical protein